MSVTKLAIWSHPKPLSSVERTLHHYQSILHSCCVIKTYFPWQCSTLVFHNFSLFIQLHLLCHTTQPSLSWVKPKGDSVTRLKVTLCPLKVRLRCARQLWIKRANSIPDHPWWDVWNFKTKKAFHNIPSFHTYSLLSKEGQIMRAVGTFH